MNELEEKVRLSCQFNYQFTLRKFEMIKRTPKENDFVFLPLTRTETIDIWERVINEYKK